MKRAGILFACALASACAGTSGGPRAPESWSGAHNDAAAARRFAAWEAATLAALATVDPRLSLRLGISPTEAEAQHAALGAILAEDTGVHVLDGRADLFSFDERARELGALEIRVSSPPRQPFAGDEATFESLEVELLSRLVTEESARVGEERRLPRSGSELLRGVVATWVAPAESALEARDEWLADRVEQIRDSLGKSGLRAAEITELEDALDPIERLADPLGFPRSEAAIARLRIALGAERAAPTGGRGWDELSAGLTVHLGIREREETLRSEIERTEARLREEASERLSHVPEERASEIRRAGAQRLLVDGACDARSGRSRIRSAGPPPERAPLCAALHSIADAKTDDDSLAALLALHDAVEIAAWSMHIEDRVDGHAPPRHALLSDVPPESQGRFLRFAAARPIACIAIARMANLLDVRGAESRQASAKRWLAFGDAPPDIVAREWGAR